MRDYVLTILSVSILSGFIRVLTPRPQDTSFAVKLVLVCVILSPLISFWGSSDITNDILVINEEFEHSITNEEADANWRRWVAESTADELSDEISERIEEVYGIKTQVVVPWREEEDGIVFDKILVYADVNEHRKQGIENWISLHYSLDSVCVDGENGDG